MPVVIQIDAMDAVVITAGGIKTHIPAGARVTINEDSSVKVYDTNCDSPAPETPEAVEEPEEEFFTANKKLAAEKQAPASMTLACEKCTMDKWFKDFQRRRASQAKLINRKIREEPEKISEHELWDEYQEFRKGMLTVRNEFKAQLLAFLEQGRLPPDEYFDDEVAEMERALFHYWLRSDALRMPGGKATYVTSQNRTVYNCMRGDDSPFGL